VGVGEADNPRADDTDVSLDCFTGSHACQYKSMSGGPAVTIR
jgi:hypothetical protein